MATASESAIPDHDSEVDVLVVAIARLSLPVGTRD